MKEGDESSKIELILSQSRFIYALARVYKNRRFSFSDLYQEAHLKILNVIEDFRGENFTSFVYSVVKNHFLDLLLHKSWRGVNLDVELEDSLSFIAEDEKQSTENENRIYREDFLKSALKILKVKERKVIRMRYLAEDTKTFREIANNLNISLASAYRLEKSAFRAIRKLAKDQDIDIASLC